MTTQYKYLHPYKRPANFADFAGADFNRAEYYEVAGRSRDSSTVEESNFRSMLRALGGESDTVAVIRDSHWAVGWIETIYVHQSDRRACDIAEDALSRLEDYPVLDDDDLSELEMDRASEYWSGMSVSERVHWCQQYRVPVFAARRDEIPDDATGSLFQALAE